MKQPIADFVRYDEGSGDPLVLLHGLFADGTQWDTILEMLKSQYRVIVVDLLGHGKSPRPKGAEYSAAEHVAALRQSLLAHNATKNVTIVGYSMGGDVGVAYAAAYPNEIRQLLLFSAPFYLRPEDMIAAHYAASMLVAKVSSGVYRLVEHVLGTNSHAQKLLGYTDDSKQFHKMIGAHDNKLDAHVVKQSIKEMVRTFDFAGALRNVTAPVSYFAGKKDPFVLQGQLRALKNLNPYMRIERLGIIKVDHMLVQNLPKEIVALIMETHETTLHVAHDEGSGETLVLLHGIESSASFWDPLLPALSEKYRVIALDLLGFGKSPKPLNVGYSIDEHIAWIHRTLEQRGVKRFTIVGHSLGSIISLAYAGAYPKDIKKMVLLSPVFLPNERYSKRYLLHGLQRLSIVPDTGYLYDQIAEVAGDDRLGRFIPTLRTIENTIHAQQPFAQAKQAKKIPTTFVYGTRDPLIDAPALEDLATVFDDASVVALDGLNHNFPLFQPADTLPIIDSTHTFKHTPRPARALPPTFIQQFVRMAVPVLAAKSLFYGIIGVLLFTKYAPYVVTLGLASYVLLQSYRTIQGAFSLKNEGLSYIGYLCLAGFGAVVAYALWHHPSFSLKVSIYFICGLVLLTGLLRILTALRWTVLPSLKRRLLITGIPMALAGMLAFAGSLKSVYAIVYTIAIVLLIKAVQYGWAATVSLAMAYIRGFNKQLS